ncbi:hypothetical protein BFJ69_g12832 [Fusarium oxysporum]|uniref:Uncharacterized protein n=1 Tax=Fusarium oxysporum TaxID=5507 RepID=A0A420MMU0_FUSOX|nr:hypothetical protein BFJ69_g12832 [Fusarium oxysporum]
MVLLLLCRSAVKAADYLSDSEASSDPECCLDFSVPMNEMS